MTCEVGLGTIKNYAIQIGYMALFGNYSVLLYTSCSLDSIISFPN